MPDLAQLQAHTYKHMHTRTHMCALMRACVCDTVLALCPHQVSMPPPVAQYLCSHALLHHKSRPYASNFACSVQTIPLHPFDQPPCCNCGRATEHRRALELSEQRRQAEMQDAAFREDARRRQAHHLAEVATLNREVRAHVRIHICARVCAHMCALVCVCMCACIWMCMPAVLVCTRVYVCISTRACASCVHQNVRAHARVFVQARILAQACVRKHTAHVLCWPACAQVEHYRAEARAAVASLQTEVEQTNTRLRAKEAELDHLQRNAVHHVSVHRLQRSIVHPPCVSHSIAAERDAPCVCRTPLLQDTVYNVAPCVAPCESQSTAAAASSTLALYQAL